MAAIDAERALLCFKPVAAGWVFRAPNPWIFGDAPHYLIDDTQKARIAAILTPRKPVLIGIYVAAALVAWVFAVAGLAWALGLDADKATPGEFTVMIVLFAAPVLAGLPLVGAVQLRRLRPLLAGAPITQERITLADMNQAMADTMSVGRSLKLGGTWVFIGLMQVANLMIRNSQHPLFSDALSYILPIAAVAAALTAARYFRVAVGKKLPKQDPR